MRKFTKEDILEMDFNAYLASSSDEDESEKNENGNHDLSDDEDKKIEKYKVKEILLTFCLRLLQKFFVLCTLRYLV